jgi:hypothetical protein
MDKMSTVTYGASIKKYAQTTPSADGVSSFFFILLLFFIQCVNILVNIYEKFNDKN